MDIIKFLVYIRVWHAFSFPLSQAFLLTLHTCLKLSPLRHPILRNPILSLTLFVLLLYFWSSPASSSFSVISHRHSWARGEHQSGTCSAVVTEKSCSGLKKWGLLSSEGGRIELMPLFWVMPKSQAPSLVLGLYPSIYTEVMPSFPLDCVLYLGSETL